MKNKKYYLEVATYDENKIVHWTKINNISGKLQYISGAWEMLELMHQKFMQNGNLYKYFRVVDNSGKVKFGMKENPSTSIVLVESGKEEKHENT